MDLIDIEVALKYRGHEHKRRNKALPKTESEAREFAVFTRHFPGWVRTRRTPSQNAQQQDKHKHGQRGFHRNSSCPYASTGHGHEKFQKDRLPRHASFLGAHPYTVSMDATACYFLNGMESDTIAIARGLRRARSGLAGPSYRAVPASTADVTS